MTTMKLSIIRPLVWWILLFVCVFKSATECIADPTSLANSTGSCNFDNGTKCGYTFNGYWQTYNGLYNYIGQSIPGSRGKTGDVYALFDFGHSRSNNDYTLVSQRIPTGHFCLSFWFYKSSQTSFLNVQQVLSSSTDSLWNATGSPAKQWVHKTLEVQSSDSFQIVFKTDKPGFFDYSTVAIDDIVVSVLQNHISTAVPAIDTVYSLLPTPSSDLFGTLWMETEAPSITSLQHLSSTDQPILVTGSSDYYSVFITDTLQPKSALSSSKTSSTLSLNSIQPSPTSIKPSNTAILSESLDHFRRSGTKTDLIQPTQSFGPAIPDPSSLHSVQQLTTTFQPTTESNVSESIEYFGSSAINALQPSSSFDPDYFLPKTSRTAAHQSINPSASFFNVIFISKSLDETLHVTPTPTVSFQTASSEESLRLSGIVSQGWFWSELTSFDLSPSMSVSATSHSVDSNVHYTMTVAPPAFITYEVSTDVLQPSPSASPAYITYGVSALTSFAPSPTISVSSISQSMDSKIHNAMTEARPAFITSAFITYGVSMDILQPSTTSETPMSSTLSSVVEVGQISVSDSERYNSIEFSTSPSVSVLSSSWRSEISELPLISSKIFALNSAPALASFQIYNQFSVSPSIMSRDLMSESLIISSNASTTDMLVTSGVLLNTAPLSLMYQTDDRLTLSPSFSIDRTPNPTSTSDILVTSAIEMFPSNSIPLSSLHQTDSGLVLSSRLYKDLISYSLSGSSIISSSILTDTSTFKVLQIAPVMTSNIHSTPASWNTGLVSSSVIERISTSSGLSATPAQWSSANFMDSSVTAATSEASPTPTLWTSVNHVTSGITTTPTTPTTITTTSLNQQMLYSALHISCGGNRWNISVDMTVMRRLYTASRDTNIYLGNIECKGMLENDTLTFQQPLRNCSSTEMKTNASLNFRNKLIYAEHDPFYSFIIRRRVWEVNVECDVPRTAVAHTHLQHGTTHLPDVIMTPSPEQSILTLQFFRDSAYQNTISGPVLHVSLGDLVYVKAFTSTLDSSVKLVLQSCYVQPQAGPSAAMQYYLIKDRCVTDRNTHIISYSQHEVRFEFQEVEFSADPTGLEIYCQAKLCDLLDFTARCSPSCGSEHIIG